MKAESKIFWLRLITGEEIIADTISTANGYDLYEPMILTSSMGEIVLVPYGMGCAIPRIFLKDHAVLWAEEASEPVTKFYDFARRIRVNTTKNFNEILVTAREMYERAYNEGEPSDEDLDNLETEETVKKSTTEIVDNLVNLAERLGKGRGDKKH